MAGKKDEPLPYECHDMALVEEAEPSNLELAITGAGCLIVSPIVAAITVAGALVLGANEIIQQSKRLFYEARGFEVRRVDEDCFLPYYEIKS